MKMEIRTYLLLFALAIFSHLSAMDYAPRLSFEQQTPIEKQQRLQRRVAENQLVQKVQGEQLDPNACLEKDDRPLDVVCRLRSIQALLAAGANPALCKTAILLHVLNYYTDRQERSEEDFSDVLCFAGISAKQPIQDRERRIKKVIECFSLLLDAGADPNARYFIDSPLERIIIFDSRCYFSSSAVRKLLSLLIWHGVDPQGVNDMVYHGYLQHRLMVMPPPHYAFLKQDIMKYQAVNQLYVCHRDATSRIFLLPSEVLELIIAQVKLLWFEKPKEPVVANKELFHKPGERKQNEPEINNSKAISPLLPELAHQVSSVVIEQDVEREENDEQLRASRRCFLYNRFLFIGGAAVIGVGYWIYSKWRSHKIKQAKERQRLSDEYPRNRIIY